MKITVFGTGYVGLVSGVCFAARGHDVICVDVDPAIIERLQQGQCTIYEPGLDDLLHSALQQQKIIFTQDAASALKQAQYIFIAVGTPQSASGAADLRYVMQVASAIGKNLDHEAVIITKSTVPVGTGDKVTSVIEKELLQSNRQIDFHVVSNPEFLKEGCAVDDFFAPDRIVIGAEDERALSAMRDLYQDFIEADVSYLEMSRRSAEFTKYAANAMLAARISFMNEMSRIADAAGADIEEIRRGMGTDNRIGPRFLLAGCGYGGSCFPKDVRALQHTAAEYGVDTRLLPAIDSANEIQKQVLFNKIRQYFGDDLKGKTIALWGLAFKPNTDDMREASSRVLLDALLTQDVRIKAYDPKAMSEAQKLYADNALITFCDNKEQALEQADALVIVTEWQQFREADLVQAKQLLRTALMFDGRNLFEPQVMQQAGWEYIGIGRGK